MRTTGRAEGSLEVRDPAAQADRSVIQIDNSAPVLAIRVRDAPLIVKYYLNSVEVIHLQLRIIFAEPAAPHARLSLIAFDNDIE